MEFLTVNGDNSLIFNHHHPKHTSRPPYSHKFIGALQLLRQEATQKIQLISENTVNRYSSHFPVCQVTVID